VIHDDQREVSARTAGRLVAEQFPQYADLEIRPLETDGTDNEIFAVGSHLAARFPRRAADPDRLAAQLRAQADAQQEFAAVSTVPAPRPRGIGSPGPGFDLPWTLQTWVPGTIARPDGLADSSRFATDLADLV